MTVLSPKITQGKNIPYVLEVGVRAAVGCTRTQTQRMDEDVSGPLGCLVFKDGLD